MYRTTPHLILSGLLLTAGVACTSIAKSLAGQPVPGYGITEKAAAEMGCDLEDIKTCGEQYKKESYAEGGPGYAIPSVGDSGCDVFANGVPLSSFEQRERLLPTSFGPFPDAFGKPSGYSGFLSVVWEVRGG